MELTGHTLDLEDLKHWTADNPISVVKAEKRYDLVMPFGVVGTYHEEVRKRAGTYMVALNGIGAVFGDAYAGVELSGGMYTIDETGQRRDAFLQIQGASMRIRGGRVSLAVNGQSMSDPTRGLAAPFLAVAEGTTAARDALQIIGRPLPSWSELYVAYELDEANSGGGEMIKAGWIGEDELNLFRRTVNNYNTLGVHARHAKSEWVAPANPMTHPQAVALIRRLVGAWLKCQIGNHRRN
jgi:hypothetical protein